MQKKRGRKYFCLSIQRSGTTSVGKFFRDAGLQCADWHVAQKNDWSGAYHNGNLDAIFGSKDFQQADAFEDGPWFHPGFYKILYHRFPGARFVMLTRDPNDWFASMLSHSGGRILGRPWIHSKIYRREEDFFACQDDGLVDASGNSFTDEAQAMTLKGMDSHYKKLYVLHQREVTEFFSKYAPHALFVGKLDDPNKWQKMAKFLEMDISEDYDSHENATHARTHARTP